MITVTFSLECSCIDYHSFEIFNNNAEHDIAVLFSFLL